MATLELLPIYIPAQSPDAHGKALEAVEAEFADGSTSLRYVDERPLATHSAVLRYGCQIDQLPLRQLFVLKWVRMCDRAGLLPVLTDEPYQSVRARCYAGCVVGDDGHRGSRIVFSPVGHAQPSHDDFEGCIKTYTEPFDDVYRLVGSMVRTYLVKWPDTPMAKFARLNMGKVPDLDASKMGSIEASAAASPVEARAIIDPPQQPAPVLATVANPPPPSIARRSVVLTELLLTPLYQEKEIPDYHHQTVVEFVENEFAHEATTLVYVEDRGSQTFFHRMILRRAIGTLPARHLFVLKWLRMMDYASLIPALMDLSDGSYEKFIAQFYMAVMNGDSKAAVEYVQTRSGGSWFEDNRTSLQEKCLFHFTPYFDNAFSGAVEMVNVYVSHFPDTGMAEWARRQLSTGSGGAWATSR